MKKNNFYLFNLLIILCFGLSFVACSDDDDNDNGNGTENLIIGKWQPVSVSEESVNDINSMFYSLRDDIIEFLGDKTVTYDESDTYYFSSKPDPNTKSTWSFRVEEFGNEQFPTLNIAGKGVFFFKEDFFIVSISDTKLIISNGIEYEFKRIK